MNAISTYPVVVISQGILMMSLYGTETEGLLGD